MLKHFWSILSKRSVIDGQTNNLSLFDVVEQLSVTAKKNPNTPDVENPDSVIKTVQFEGDLVTLIGRDGVSEEKLPIEVNVEFLDPNKNVLDVVRHKGAIEKKRLRIRTHFSVLPINRGGEYLFRVKLKGPNDEKFKVVGAVPLDVTVSYQ